MINRLKNLPTRVAFYVLKRAIQRDPGYAWAWHCNIAMTGVDAGCDHTNANHGAAAFMKLCFDVNTATYPAFATAVESA